MFKCIKFTEKTNVERKKNNPVYAHHRVYTYLCVGVCLYAFTIVLDWVSRNRGGGGRGSGEDAPDTAIVEKFSGDNGARVKRKLTVY